MNMMRGISGRTERRSSHKRAEEKLRKSEERYRAFIEATAQVVWTTNAGGKVVVDLPAWREVTGQSEEAIQGWGWIEAVHPDDRERATQAWIRAVETTSPYENEFRVRKYDGNYRLFFARGIPVLEADGSIREWVGTCTDITERKRMEEQYRTIVRTALDGFWIVDTQGRFLDVNDAYSNLIGYSRGELLTMRIPDIEACEKPGETAVRVRKIMEMGGDRFETRHRCKDGRIVDIEVSVNYMQAGERFFVFLRDITDRKRAEAELTKHREHLADLVEERTAELQRTNEALETEITERKQAAAALRESEAKYHALFQTSVDGILVADLETRIFKYANPAACRLLGYSEAELTTMRVADIHPKDDLPWVVAEFEAQVRGDKTLAAGVPCLRKDGAIVYADVNAVGMSVDGRACNAGFFRDITERKRAEEALAYKTMLLEAHLQTSIDGILAVDTFGHAILLNKRFIELWRMPQHILDEKDDAKLLEYALTQLKDPAEFSRKVAYLYEHKDEKCRDEIEFADGRCFDRYSSPLLGTEGTYCGRIWYFYDITERKLAEEKLKLTLADLERSNMELEQFAYVASHDLQEPLRMVSSYTQLLARRYQGKLGTDADEFIAFAVDGATRMEGLINDLLAYSRVGTRVKGLETTDCTAVLDQALANLKAAIEKSGAVVTHHPLPTVMADNLQLAQLFQNLIGNAIKFHVEEPPRIHVSAEQKGNAWVFSVRDNGIGIDPQYAERIFVIFQRLHTREEYPGTGIGLAICKKIVERRGGRIWVESQAGIGSTFYFTIPIGGNGL